MRKHPLSVLSILIIFGIFVFMRQTFRVSSNIAEVAKRSSPQRHVLGEPSNTLEAADDTELPTFGVRLKKLLNCADRSLHLEKLQYGEYWLLRNYVIGAISATVGCADTITLTTHGDYTFFEFLPMLIKRWQAPISFALYAPGYDFNATMDSLNYARNCLKESSLIRDYVTFHIYFPATDMPEYVPLSKGEEPLWPYNCDSLAPYLNVERSSMYKTVQNMTYPINVGRNIARKSVNTYFIFASDMELYPTPNLPQKFLEMIESDRSVYLNRTSERVFVLPIFEVTKDSTVPENKTHLVQMLRKKKAIHFHQMVCKICHLVPNQDKWVNASDTDELTTFSSAKRQGKFQYWEPFYISDNQEPIFDERVTWEGQSNKRIQNYAMCLLGYDYFVLHPPFLVHTPGIKYYKKNDTRYKYVPPMNKLIKTVIQPEYEILYGHNTKCRL